MTAPLRLVLLTSLTMVAFAANSILNRLAVAPADLAAGAIDAGSFAVIRVLAGAMTLVLLARLSGRTLVFATRARLIGAGSLTAYMVGFSLAYLSLDAGLGALLVFGIVQVTIFAISAAQAQPATWRQIIGSGVAFGGLVWVLWPGADWAVDPGGAAAMVLAGIGWGIYTLAGRQEADALAGTAANFCLALPLTVFAVWAAMRLGEMNPAITAPGVFWAVLSGAVTSGLGYALWYTVLPAMAPAIAAIVMLSVPVIALLGGIALLGESASLRLVAGAVLVIGGIAWAAAPARRKSDL